MSKAETYPEHQNYSTGYTYDGQFFCWVHASLEDSIKDSNIQYEVRNSSVYLTESNAVDFLEKFTDFYNPKHLQFLTHAELLDRYDLCQDIKIKLVDENAVIPSKTRGSDAGYDLNIIRLHKQLTPKTALYDTGIQIEIPAHHYVEIVPRSSISKTGYMLANNVGIIDSAYKGNLYVALTKIDESMPDIELPFRICQLILRKQYFMNFEQTENIAATSRNDGGFGSTNSTNVDAK
jgi:dUTP pyrophosphatase